MSFVRQLIGRQAGMVIPLPFSAAQNALASGTAAPVTDAEVVAAGFELEPAPVLAPPETVPLGYRLEPTDGGGFDVFDPGGVRLNEAPLPNLPAARDVAIDSAQAGIGAVAVVVDPVTGAALVDDGGDDLDLLAPGGLREGYRVEALGDGRLELYDPSGVVIGDGSFADLDAAALFADEHHAAALAQGDGADTAAGGPPALGPDMPNAGHGVALAGVGSIGGALALDAAAAAAGAGADGAGAGAEAIVVPDDWRTLHHATRKSLARKISGADPVDTAEADRVIEAFVARP